MQLKDHRIAFLTADWNFELVESTLRGLKQYVDEHENIHLRVFDCFGKDLDNEKDKSEYAIYQLADLSQFDGVMVQGNQIVLKRVRDELGERIVRAGIPAVSIDCPVAGCEFFGIDNEQAEYDIVEHVIQKHGAKKLVYLTGLLANGCPEGKQRLSGFLSACRHNGVSHENAQVIECTWRTSDGVTIASQWVEEHRPLPDAFVCANDEMALGLMEALEDSGVRIPQDVIVVGFDNVSSAEISTPRLSTVFRDNQRLMYSALDLLVRRIEGEKEKPRPPFPHALVCSESCGCREGASHESARKKYFKQNRFLKAFYTMQDDLAEDLFEASSLMELMEIVEDNKTIFGCGSVYLCINDYYFDNYDKNQWCQDSESFGEEMILAACGRSGIASGRQPYARFPRDMLLPGALGRENRFLVLYPLHYNTYSIGYLVMDGISEAAKLNLHMSIFSFLEIAFENVRKKCLLHHFNDFLDNLSVHDALTGLYNRFGYERFGQKAFEAFLTQDGSAQILFIDMDHMKQINDQFGHEIGDEAIRGAADVIQKACSPHDFMMRYGGDEFLVIASARESSLEETLQRAVGAYNAQNKWNPFTLSLSVGSIHASSRESRSLDEYVQAADVQMYEQKSRRKTCRN